MRDWALYSHVGYEEGKVYPCRYDPENPDTGTVRNEFNREDSEAVLALGLVVLLLGAAVPGIFRLIAENAELRRRA